MTPQRLWQSTVVVVAASAVLTTVYVQPPWFAALAGLLVLGAHAVVLGIEFALAAAQREQGVTPLPGFTQRIQAWCEEVRVDARMFGWEQAFRLQRHPPRRLGNSGHRGIVFVHGFLCNRAVWHPWIDRLGDGVPYVAIETPGLLLRIESGVEPLDRAVAWLERATGMPPVVLAHSMGGLLVRRWLATCQADARVAGVVTVATPHRGTRFARVGLGANVRQMRLGSSWLDELHAMEPASRAALFTCFYGHCDNIVVPASNATMDGARNCHLLGVAHLAMLYHPAVFAEVMLRLREPAGAAANGRELRMR